MDATTVRHVPGAGGLRLCVREHGEPAPGKPHVLLVHGYPDRQDMWGPLLEALGGDAFHLITYDVRGAGDSEVPQETAGYRTPLLVDDLAAVIAATVPDGERVHLVGHDWGSVQLWEAVRAEADHPGLHGRIAGFTSVSGPPLSHVGWLRHHSQGRRTRLLRQALHSWYLFFFLVPRLPELLWRTGPVARALLRRGGARHVGPGLAHDATHGLGLYRANVRGGAGHRRGPTDVPVLVVHPERDAFITPVLLEDLDRVAPRLRLERVDAGHWLPRSRPEQLAALVAEHVRAHA